ncbi:MAG: hypothetical protein ACRC8Q_06830, partial [Aeromonas sp.]
LPGEREEAATRYLYRAWRSGDIQKRGLHFIRTYLQLLFPEQSEVRQMWHVKDQPYGSAFVSNQPRDPFWYHFLGQADLKLDGDWKVGRPFASDGITPPAHTPDESTLFLTSRIEILLGLEAIATGVSQYSAGVKSATSGLLDVIRAVIPARLVPMFRFWLRFVLAVQVRADYALLMQNQSRVRQPWCGRVITDQTDAKWQLGRDGVMVKLAGGLKLGAFKLSERRGGISHWKLKPCRITSTASMQIAGTAPIGGIAKLGQLDRRLTGTWALGRAQIATLTHSKLDKRITMTQITAAQVTYHELFELHATGKPQRLGSRWSIGNRWRLDGSVRVPQAISGGKLGGVRLRTGRVVTVAALTARAETSLLAGASLRLSRDMAADLSGAQNRKTQQMRAELGGNIYAEEFSGGAPRLLDGTWRIGEAANPEFSLVITRV